MSLTRTYRRIEERERRYLGTTWKTPSIAFLVVVAACVGIGWLVVLGVRAL
jgi:hypothetical protein